MREARCHPPPGAGHAPGSSDPVTDLLCQVNDILPALGGNGPSPQSCLFFLNSQTLAAQEWAVYGLCACPRRQAIRDAELHVPPTVGDLECGAARPQGTDPGRRLGQGLSSRSLLWETRGPDCPPSTSHGCHSISSLLKPPPGRQQAAGDAGGPAQEPGSTGNVVSLLPPHRPWPFVQGGKGQPGVGVRTEVDPWCLYWVGGALCPAKVQPRRELRTI